MATQEYEELPLKLQDAFNALQGLAKVRINLKYVSDTLE